MDIGLAFVREPQRRALDPAASWRTPNGPHRLASRRRTRRGRRNRLHRQPRDRCRRGGRCPGTHPVGGRCRHGGRRSLDGGGSAWRGAMCVALWDALAMISTAGVGALFGTTVGSSAPW